MLDIGVDFGSTYTTVSVYRKETDTAEAIPLFEGDISAAIPTALAISRNGRISAGESAKHPTGGMRSFRAFKMMLAEDDQALLAARGFSSDDTPAAVTAKFLEKVLGEILGRLGEDTIHRLSIGAPEIWSHEMTETEVGGKKYSRLTSSVDGRAVLRDICKKLPMLPENSAVVQVISEPIAASAFYAYNFYKRTEQLFDGHILLIDYGGGTLDITLTQISPRVENDKVLGMEVRAPFKTGAGENQERGKIGRAGIVYMETLTKEAIKAALRVDTVENDKSFYKALDELERFLKSERQTINFTFAQAGTDPQQLSEDDMDDLCLDYIFKEIQYKGEDIPVTYQLMAQVYDDVIRPIFDEKLDEVITYMDSHAAEVDYTERNVDKFKIVLAGGFGNYYLVKKQVSDKFHFGSKDLRKEYVMSSTNDGELAVSRGAALIAADKIRIRNTAPCSIGVAVSIGKSLGRTFAFRYNQDITFGKEYFQMDASGNYQTIISHGGYIDKLLINLQEDIRATLVMTPKPELLKKLNNAIQNPAQAAVAAFSLDSSGVITLHIHELDIIENVVSPECHSIELTSLYGLFDVQQMERAFPNG